MLLSYMTADIGAHHNRAWTITRNEDLGKDEIKGKAKVVVYLQHIRPFFDVVSCCRLLWGDVDVTPLARSSRTSASRRRRRGSSRSAFSERSWRPSRR